MPGDQRTDPGLRRAHRASRWLAAPFVRFDGLPIPEATIDALDRGCVLATNHRSMFDAFTGFAVLGEMQLTARPVSADWLWEHRLLGRLLDSVGAIPLGTGRAALTAIEAATERLDAGEIILVTPEGRIVPPDERVAGVGAGTKLVSRIARSADVPVVPAAMLGTDTFWPLGRKLPKLRPFRPVTVRYALGEPLRFGPSHGDNVTATMAAISSLLQILGEPIDGR